MLEIETDEEFTQYLADNDFVIVDFFASWCKPCKTIAPKVQAFSEIFTDTKFVKVNAEELEEAQEKYKVNGLPHFVFLQKGKQVLTYTGSDEETLEKHILEFREKVGLLVLEHKTANLTEQMKATVIGDKDEPDKPAEAGFSDDMFSNDDF